MEILYTFAICSYQSGVFCLPTPLMLFSLRQRQASIKNPTCSRLSTNKHTHTQNPPSPAGACYRTNRGGTQNGLHINCKQNTQLLRAPSIEVESSSPSSSSSTPSWSLSSSSSSQTNPNNKRYATHLQQTYLQAVRRAMRRTLRINIDSL